MIIALCQINTTVGAIGSNLEKIKSTWSEIDKEVDIVVFPELAISGYPAEDLINNGAFLKSEKTAVYEIIKFSEGLRSAALIGISESVDGKLYNCCIIVQNGKVIHTIHKTELPNYGVFDELRNFSPGENNAVVQINGKKVGVLVCEDGWFLETAKKLTLEGAEIFISINASPFSIGKHFERYKVAKNIVDISKTPYCYVNLVGAQDEIVFDGGSFALNAKGEYIELPSFWSENTKLVNINTHNALVYKEEQVESAIYNAILIALRDYVEKNGFSKCILGLSGGIDSAVVAAIAVDALGADNVLAFALPSRFSSDHSFDDAKELASNLSIEIESLSIEDVFKSAEKTLSPIFKDLPNDVTEENIQSRVRGLLLMAISNKFGALLLTTGNKSEYAVGYATIYGDMCGGYAPIKDVYKTDVYKLARWRNKNIPIASMCERLDIIPENTIIKAPSAELRHDQKDQDTLPEYEILDEILYQFIELDKVPSDLIEKGFDMELCNKIYKMFIRSEYKRRQSAIGPKVSIKNLGKDRRYPITNSYTGN